MIKSVTITSYLGEQVKIVLPQEEPDHGFLITGIDGLGPAKAIVNMADLVTTDGSLYNSARLEKRNIVIQLIFTDARIIEDTRQRTYRFFHIKKPIHFVIETDNRTLYTDGYVESNEPNIFSNQEGCQISILCEDPYFYREDIGTQGQDLFQGTTPMFHFKYWNGDLVEKLTVFGEIHDSFMQGEILYVGDAETGMTITIHATGTANNVWIRNEDHPQQYIHLDTTRLTSLTGSTIQAGDDIVIHTEVGKKSVILYRDGEEINILNCVDRDATWFQLIQGVNRFLFQAASGLPNLSFKMEYRTRYEGA